MTVEPGKKRRRLVISCLRCRKRKIKCDREKPCGLCIKHGVADQCQYQETPDDPLVQQAVNEMFSFRTGYEAFRVRTKRTTVTGPLKYVALLRKDPFVRATLRRSNKTNVALEKSIRGDHDHGSKRDDSAISHGDDPKILKQTKALSEFAKKYNETKICQDVISNIEPELLFLIKELIPNDVWRYIDLFFASPLFDFIPVVTHELFAENIKRLLSSDFKISKNCDFAFLGMLMLVVRMAYLIDLTLPAVSKTCVFAAMKCLDRFRIGNWVSLSVIQLTLMMRFYMKISPENGDTVDGSDSAEITGLVVQRARSIGLDLDVDSHAEGFPVELSKLWRICWYEILFLDSYQARIGGSPLIVEEDTFDTSLPLMPRMSLEYDWIQTLRPLLKAVSKLTKVNVNHIMEMVASIENFCQYCVSSSLHQIVNSPINTHMDCVAKIQKFNIYVETKTLLISVLCHVFIHFDSESQDKESFKVLKKLHMIVNELHPLTHLLLQPESQFEVTFGPRSKLLLMPTCLQILMKINVVSRVVLIRSFACNDPDRKDALGKLIEFHCGLWETVNQVNQVLSPMYYQSWRMSKSSTSILKALKGSKREVSSMKNVVLRNVFDHYTLEQIEELYESIATPKTLFDMTCNQCMPELNTSEIDKLWESMMSDSSDFTMPWDLEAMGMDMVFESTLLGETDGSIFL